MLDVNVVEQVESQLKEAIEQAVLKAELASQEEMPQVVLETPKDKSHGDYATNMAMQLARVAKKNPRQIAEEIVEHIDQQAASVKSIDIAGPGFINFFMDTSYLTDVVNTILTKVKIMVSLMLGKMNAYKLSSSQRTRLVHYT